MKYLVDTTWAVEYLRENQRFVQRLISLRAEGLAVSIVSVAELYRGVFLSNNPAGNESVLNDFLSGADILGINREIARIFGMEDARLTRSGTAVGDMDLLIAATALHYSLTLLTSDRDFERVAGLQTIFS